MIRTGRKNIKVRWKVERNFSIFFFSPQMTNFFLFQVTIGRTQESGLAGDGTKKTKLFPDAAKGRKYSVKSEMFLSICPFIS